MWKVILRFQQHRNNYVYKMWMYRNITVGLRTAVVAHSQNVTDSIKCGVEWINILTVYKCKVGMAELMESQAHNSLHTKFIQYEKSDSRAEESWSTNTSYKATTCTVSDVRSCEWSESGGTSRNVLVSQFSPKLLLTQKLHCLNYGGPGGRRVDSL